MFFFFFFFILNNLINPLKYDKNFGKQGAAQSILTVKIETWKKNMMNICLVAEILMHIYIYIYSMVH